MVTYAICRSKREIREVLISDDSQDQFLGVIHSETDLLNCIEAPWTTKLELNGRNIGYKIDTGANVTVILEQEHVCKQDRPLAQTNWVLNGPSQPKLDVLYTSSFQKTFNPIQINSIVKKFPELFQKLSRLKDNCKLYVVPY